MKVNMLRSLIESKFVKCLSCHRQIVAALPLLCAGTGCTGQISGGFLYAQQVQAFSSNQDVNTKIDLLWVVDNSSSMDVSQQKLRQGFQSFANKYMQPTWDIRVAVITTDTYLANTAFQPYLNTVVPGSVGYTSPYIASRLTGLKNPSWNASLMNLTNGSFPSGFTYGEQLPTRNANFAKLLPGLHDGPITTICFDPMPYFLNGVSNCAVRDAQSANTGIANCVSPASGESSLSQCVNTIQNDTVHSGQAILSTLGGNTNQLIQNFMVNASPGSTGSGSERGMSSVLQLLNDNEKTSTALFRPNSLRGIIFISDEDDQSMNIPSSPPAGFKPFSGYGCDQNTLIGLNGTPATTGANGTCCTGGTCSFPTPITGSQVTTSCTPKTVDGYTYTLTVCADESQLIPVASVKSQLDQFFQKLDGSASTASANYFISTITALSGSGIQTLQTQRTGTDGSLGLSKSNEVNRGDRYISLAALVSPDSVPLDISSSDYTPILNTIGQQIISKKSTFTLARAPTNKEQMIVTVVHSNGTKTNVTSSQYSISGNQVIFSDANFVLGLASTDQISIDYQPNSAI